MKTLYAACLSRIGLSQAGAAALHGVRLDTVKGWSSGKNSVPDGVWDDLRAVDAEIVKQAAAMRELWEDHGSPPIEINSREADRASLMAAAHFVLTTIGPVFAGKSAATEAARKAREKG